jgi:hypothetical protein
MKTSKKKHKFIRRAASEAAKRGRDGLWCGDVVLSGADEASGETEAPTRRPSSDEVVSVRLDSCAARSTRHATQGKSMPVSSAFLRIKKHVKWIKSRLRMMFVLMNSTEKGSE